ncbi:MAG TPA: 50S ribosomal protein L11 methyltransferase [Rhizomicrobium sp.]|nr:50S ribosomal protein L11 methyltransferase [Rhizomicrobium sp.]
MNDRAFSSIDCVGQCMLDTEKAHAFQAIICKIARPEHAVLDVGTGSGILALFAAAAGAAKVTALEFDPFVAAIAKENFRNNGYESVIETVIGDARNFKFPEGARFDVVTMEMLTSGMVDEMQVQAINNLFRQGVVSPATIFIPYRQDTHITLAYVDFKVFGFDMKMVIHAWNWLNRIGLSPLSEKMLLNSVDFAQETQDAFDRVLVMKIIESGVVNAIWLSSRAFVDRTMSLENTCTLNAPVAVPVPDRKVRAGEEVRVHVRYRFGHGYENFIVEIL